MSNPRPWPLAALATRKRTSALLVPLLAVLLLMQGLLGPAGAADATPRMYQDQTFTGATSPTEDKPQSKVWFNDGFWWALMRSSAGVTIHKLQANHTWLNTGTVVDTRSASTGDALSEDGKLWVASRVTNGAIQGARLSYNTTTDKYTMDSGFPKSVTSGAIESVTIARDSQKRLWVTFTKPHPTDATLDQVWVAHSTTSDTTWTAPFLVPVPDNTVKADDISAITAFAGYIGVMYSDQQNQVVRFAVHPDTAADNTGWNMETALSGTRSADDHLNLKSIAGDDAGRIYAAVKTSRGDSSNDLPTDPSIRVLSRSVSGTWTPTTAATVSEGLTRPQLSLDASNKQLYVVMSTESGGNVYYRKSPLGASMSFTPRATMITWSGARINNASTAKAPVTNATGLVVLASDEKDTKRYYHAELDLAGGSTAPDTEKPSVPSGISATADSSSQVTVKWTASTDNVGVASYQVKRNGTSIADAVPGTATSYVDTTVSPSTAYTYTVNAVDAANNRSADSTAASVTTPAASQGPTAGFTASPTSGPAPLAVQFTDTSTGSPTSRSWDFGDGSATSTATNPSHTYTQAGTFTAKLTVTNASGSNSATTTITVTGGGTSSGFTVAYKGTTAAPTLPADSALTAGNLTAGPGTTLGIATLSQYNPNKVWTATHTATTTTAAAAVTNNAYHSVTVSRTGGAVFKALRLKAAKGGASAPRGFVVRSSVDNYATNLLAAEVSSVRPTLTDFSADISGLGTQSSVTFRIYHYAPSTSAAIDFDDLEIDYSSAG
jgi:PKD repeat protein